MKQYTLQFDGYWREVNKGGAPDCSGVYLIYTCKYNKTSDKVSLSDIIYIGQSKNMKSRIASHSEEEFKEYIKQGETLCYACAPVDEKDLDLVENALIYAQKPVGNDRLKDSYSYEDVNFTIEGKCSLLKYTSFNITTR